MLGKTRKMFILRDEHDGSIDDDVRQRRPSAEFKGVACCLRQRNATAIVERSKAGQAVVVCLIL